MNTQVADTERWTAKLIPTFEPWVDCKHVELNYYATQLLTGHGLFNAYLQRMGIVDSPRCEYCPENAEDVLKAKKREHPTTVNA